MAHELSNVLRQVEGLTRAGRASWRESGRPAEWLLPLPSGAVVVLSRSPYGGMYLGRHLPEPYSLSLLSEMGSELASLRSDEPGEYHARLQALYDTATRQAVDVRQRIGQVESELAAIGK